MDSKELHKWLDGKKLQDIVEFLVEYYGWDELGKKVNIRCFQENPSVKSSLKFLRRTPWARTKVEGLYAYARRRSEEKNTK